MAWWKDTSTPDERVEILSTIADNAGGSAVDVLRRMAAVREGGTIKKLG